MKHDAPREAILCVDDEPTVLKTLARTLKIAFGDRFEIETASSGEEALDLLQVLDEEETPLRLLISDALMPGMNGFELLARVHARKPDAIKILITGQSDQEQVEHLRQAIQLKACVAKPWRTKELFELIDNSLKVH